ARACHHADLRLRRLGCGGERHRDLHLRPALRGRYHPCGPGGGGARDPRPPPSRLRGQARRHRRARGPGGTRRTRAARIVRARRHRPHRRRRARAPGRAGPGAARGSSPGDGRLSADGGAGPRDRHRARRARPHPAGAGRRRGDRRGGLPPLAGGRRLRLPRLPRVRAHDARRRLAAGPPPRDGARAAPPGSHDYKELVTVFNALPKSELLASTPPEIRADLLQILAAVRSEDVVVSVRSQPANGRLAVLVVLPPARFSSEARQQIGALLRERLGGTLLDDYLTFVDGDRALLHFTLTAGPGTAEAPSAAELRDAVAAMVRTWEERLREAL